MSLLNWLAVLALAAFWIWIIVAGAGLVRDLYRDE